jgi:hypothetical protein
VDSIEGFVELSLFPGGSRDTWVKTLGGDDKNIFLPENIAPVPNRTKEDAMEEDIGCPMV